MYAAPPKANGNGGLTAPSTPGAGCHTIRQFKIEYPAARNRPRTNFSGTQFIGGEGPNLSYFSAMASDSVEKAEDFVEELHTVLFQHDRMGAFAEFDKALVRAPGQLGEISLAIWLGRSASHSAWMTRVGT